MTERALAVAQLRAQVRAVRQKLPHERFVGLHYPGPWKGETTLEVDGAVVRVVPCRSQLELREHLAQSEEKDPKLLVLVGDLDSADLGADVLARLAKGRMLQLERWPTVKSLFRAQTLDPRLTSSKWMADALIEAAPASGYPPVASGFLDQATAWRALLDRHLGLPQEPSGPELIEWALDIEHQGRWQRAPEELRAEVARWLRPAAGRASDGVLRALSLERGDDSLSLGLVCRVLWSSEAEGKETGQNETEENETGQPQPIGTGVVRFEERFFGAESLDPETGLAWADAAEKLLGKWREAGRGDQVREALKRAQLLLTEIKAAEEA